MTDLVTVKDEVAELLDELAELSEYWKKNRSKGRMPKGVRAGMIILSEEINNVVNRPPLFYAVKE